MEKNKTQIKINSEDTAAGGKSINIEPQENLIGKTIGDYTIIREIGRGGMAVVYEAHQISLDRNVAIKIIPQVLIEDPDYLERFKREASSAANLNHPNIVSIHGFGQFDNTYYYVMDLAKGKTLDAIIEDKKHEILKRAKVFAPDDALKIIEQAASALSYAHKQGVIHRDIKSSNLMIDEESGRVLITDFGLAKSTRWEKITPNASLFGTPAYMSPEQASGRELDQRTDIYSLGVVLYEMLTGTLPFSGSNALEVIDKVKTEALPSPRKINPNIQEGIESIILRAISKNIKLRYQKMEEFLTDIEHYREGKKITSFVKIAEQKVKQKRNLKLYVFLGIIGFLTTLGLVFGIYLMTNYLQNKTRTQNIESQLQLAANYEQLGLKDDALRIYKGILEKYPNTPFAKIAEEKLSKK